MKKFLPLLCLSLFVSGALAQENGDAAFLAKFESTFETPGMLPAKDFVPAEFLTGRLHEVRPQTSNDGLRNTYYIDTAEGVQEITGTPALLERIREIYAIDYLRGLSGTEEFTKALRKAGRAKIESAVEIVSDPFGTIKNVPKGASRFFGRIGEGLKTVGKKSEAAGGGSGMAEILGVTKAKAKLAAQLGVSPYSTNEELQHQLTKAAQATAGGGLIINAAATFATGGAGIALTVAGVNETLSETLANSTPEDLRIINRKKLFELGVSRELADEFLMHPWYSPWSETIVTDALAKIGADPTDFLNFAVRALTPEDAFYFMRLSQILAAYHASAAPIVSIQLRNRIVSARDRNGVLVVPVSCDYGIWAERMARRTEEFTSLDLKADGISGLALWTDGRISERLSEELKKRGIHFRTEVLVKK